MATSVANTIDDFKAQLIGGGARPNLFQAIMNFPSFAGGSKLSQLGSFLIKSAQIPAATVGNIQVAFRGRKANIAGDREFPNITISVINDGNFTLRNAFEQWVNQISQNKANIGLVDPNDYKVDWVLNQLDRQQNIIQTYTITGSYPVNVGEIEVSYDSENEIETFNVELTVDYWENSASTS